MSCFHVGHVAMQVWLPLKKMIFGLLLYRLIFSCEFGFVGSEGGRCWSRTRSTGSAVTDGLLTRDGEVDCGGSCIVACVGEFCISSSSIDDLSSVVAVIYRIFLRHNLKLSLPRQRRMWCRKRRTTYYRLLIIIIIIIIHSSCRSGLAACHIDERYDYFFIIPRGNMYWRTRVGSLT